MKNLLLDQTFLIPSIKNFISDIQDDLLTGRNVIVLLPPWVPPEDIRSNIQEEFWRRDVLHGTVSVQAENPVTLIRDEFSIELRSPTDNHTIENLFAATGLPEIVFLKDFQGIPLSEQDIWVDFLRTWAQKCQQLDNQAISKVVFCVIEQASNFLYDKVETNVRQAIHWWWGFPSFLELQLLCRTSNDVQDWGPAARWREQLLPSLSTSDLTLIGILWDDIYKDSDEVIKALQIYADDLGWGDLNDEIDMNDSINFTQYDLQSSYPPKRLQRLWSRGIIYANKEFGIEIHPAALIEMGKVTDLHHRLWRGQAQLLLPVIDNLRLDICKNLTKELGEEWPIKWDKPSSTDDFEMVQSNPLSVQWGYLEHLIRYNREFTHYRHLATIVSFGRKLRNEIAHYQPVSFADYKNFLENIKSNSWLSG